MVFCVKGISNSKEKNRPNAVTASDKPVQYAILLTRMSKYLIQQRSIFQACSKQILLYSYPDLIIIHLATSGLTVRPLV